MHMCVCARGVDTTRYTHTHTHKHTHTENASVADGARELTLKEKAERVLIDDELEYLIFWADLTQFVKNRWGTMQDGLLNEYTRLFDFNATKVYIYIFICIYVCMWIYVFVCGYTYLYSMGH